jgi:hypothetical protein
MKRSEPVEGNTRRNELSYTGKESNRAQAPNKYTPLPFVKNRY